MENRFQSQLVAVRNRVQNLKDAKKAENQNAAEMGMNTNLLSPTSSHWPLSYN